MDIVSAVFSAAAICAVLTAFRMGYDAGRRTGGETPKKQPILGFVKKKNAAKLPENEEMEKVLGGISNILRYDGTKQD